MSGVHFIEPDYESARNGNYAIVASRYNLAITEKLVTGAIEALAAHGIPLAQITVANVPGAWEIPLVAQGFAHSGRYVAVICLGAVIKGETSHDEHINRQVSDSLGHIALSANVPVLMGVLTCNTVEQAIHRSGGNHGNKGVECADAAWEMVALQTALRMAGEMD